MLVQLLNRSNEELLILVISFLKKLSLYAENKVITIYRRTAATRARWSSSEAGKRRSSSSMKLAQFAASASLFNIFFNKKKTLLGLPHPPFPTLQ
jgi:hypothetical protein